MIQPDIIFSHPLLYLRKIISTDAAFLLKIHSHPDVMKYTGELPWQTILEARNFIRYNTKTSIHGTERWLVCKPDGLPVGLAGYRAFNDNPKVWDVSFRFLPEYWNQGYAYTTLHRLTQHAFGVCSRNAIRAQVHEENLASSNVVQKCGYYLDHRFNWGGMTWRCYYIKKEDFQVL